MPGVFKSLVLLSRIWGVADSGGSATLKMLMPNDRQAVDEVIDLFSTWGATRAKSMFGGHGFFRENLMFALMVDNQLYLKADEESRGRFDELELPPFSYLRRGERATLDYFQAPESLYEGHSALQPWADLAFACAVRRDEAKPPSKRKRMKDLDSME